MKEKKIILSKTNRILLKISCITNMLIVGLLAMMLIPFTPNNGQLSFPCYKYSLVVLLIASIIATLLAGIALERTDKETQKRVM